MAECLGGGSFDGGGNASENAKAEEDADGKFLAFGHLQRVDDCDGEESEDKIVVGPVCWSKH